MKKLSKIILVILMIFISYPVFAKNNISVEGIKLINSTEELTASDDKIDISFNDLEQYAKYEVVLKNNTEDNLFINDIDISKVSEDFIHFILDEDSIGTKINAGKTAKVNVLVKTLEIEGAGKNTNDKINLKLKLEESIENPATNNNSIELILSIILLGLLMFVCFYKSDKKVKVSIVVITLLLLGTTTVLADDEIAVSLEGNVSYKSQNLMKESGTTVTNNKIDYSTSEDVWKYYDKVKNINISSISKFDEEYVEEFDLTIGSNSRVKGYLIESDTKDMYDLHIASRGVIYAPADSTALFSFPKVEKIDGLENVVFEETTTFTGMFMGNEEMKEVNVESIDFSNAEDTSNMFTKCYEVEIEEEKLNIPEEAKSENTFIMYLYDEVKKNAVSDVNVDFSTEPATGTYYIESTKNDTNPVYYYRGAVTDNNVIFANKCWKMVRTTETGGIKLIYNGIPSNEGTCNNKGDASRISASPFNMPYTSPTVVGYMYGTVYTSTFKNLQSQTSTYVYGNDITWDGKKYTLTGATMNSSSWVKNYKTLAKKYHYTCFNSTGTCETIYYINYFAPTGPYYLTLNDGKNIDDAKDEMFANVNDSQMKTTIDNWYASNMTAYTGYLEDTIWCNDRTLTSGALYSKDTNGAASSFFGAYNNRDVKEYTPSVNCAAKRDSFTVDSKNGNGKLTYPVGLLTADEYTMAGSGNKGYSTSSYLYVGGDEWSLSPYRFSFNVADTFFLHNNGYLYITSVSPNSIGRSIRPSVSLKSGVDYIAGTGTITDPYIVE